MIFRSIHLFLILFLLGTNALYAQETSALDLTGISEKLKKKSDPQPSKKDAKAPLEIIKKESAPIEKTAEVGTIKVSPLDDVDLDSVGIIENLSVFDLTRNDWDGSTREVVFDIISKMPIHYQSVTLENLSKLLLEGAFKIPKSDNPLADKNLLLIRADKLFQMGFAQEAFALLNAHRSLHKKPLYLQLKFENGIMKNHTLDACQLARQQIQLSPSPYWEKAMILCQIKDGDFDAAHLSLSVLSDGSYDSEKEFIQTAQSILAPEFKDNLVTIKPTEPLSLILLNTAPDGIHPNVLKNMPRKSRTNLVRLKPLNTTPVSRLGLLEEAVENGQLPPQELMDHYHLFAKEHLSHKKDWADISPKELEKNNTPDARVNLIFQALYGKKERQNEALRSLLSNAHAFGLYNGISKTLGKKLADINPKDGAANMADVIIPALIISGQKSEVCKWQHYIDPENEFTTIPLLLIGCEEMNSTYRDHLLTSWLSNINSYDKNIATLYAQAVLLILEVFDITTSEKQWQNLSETPNYKTMRLSPKRRQILSYASQKKRRAETIGRILVDISPEKYWTLDNILFALKNLKKVDLNKAAIQIATETILALKKPSKNA